MLRRRPLTPHPPAGHALLVVRDWRGHAVVTEHAIRPTVHGYRTACPALLRPQISHRGARCGTRDSASCGSTCQIIILVQGAFGSTRQSASGTSPSLPDAAHQRQQPGRSRIKAGGRSRSDAQCVGVLGALASCGAVDAPHPSARGSCRAHPQPTAWTVVAALSRGRSPSRRAQSSRRWPRACGPDRRRGHLLVFRRVTMSLAIRRRPYRAWKTLSPYAGQEGDWSWLFRRGIDFLAAVNFLPSRRVPECSSTCGNFGKTSSSSSST